MINFKNKLKKFNILFYIYLYTGILIGLFFSPVISLGIPSKAIIGPISVLGDIPSIEQQIIFNHFREQMNKGYHLVSHKVLELISEQGLKSFDIEDCNNSKCVRIVLNFLNNLRQKYNADDLFLFQLVQNKSETQLSLKFASLSVPEVTKNIVNQSCKKCDIKKLKISVENIVQKMFTRIGRKNLEHQEIDSSPKLKMLDNDLAPLNEDIKREKIDHQKDELASPKKQSERESDTNLEIDEGIIEKEPRTDSYTVERDLYNQHIGQLLTDVTYALQIFRTGMFVQIEVSIDPSGTVVNQKILKSSGSHDFDETAMMTLEDIQFDPLTDNMLKFGNYIVNLQIHNSR